MVNIHANNNIDLNLLFRRLEPKIINKLEKSINKIIRESKTQVPVDTGFLQSTGEAVLIHSGNFEKGVVQYSASYAENQHENVYNHPGGGHDHYLSEPTDDEIPNLIAAITKLFI